MLVSQRAATEDRLDMLRVVVGRLAHDLAGSGVRVALGESTPVSHRGRAMSIWTESDLDVDVIEREEPIVSSYLRLLAGIDRPYVMLQLDDQLTAGLTPSFVAASAALLERASPLVDIVSVHWPLAVDVDHARRVITVTVAEHRDGRYRFKETPWLTPVCEVEVAGHRFGIFENFSYGFFMNHSVMPTRDFERRLAWYVKRLRTTDAHHIENMAAAKRRGPFWSHVAICLDAAALLDIDYAHSATSDRVALPELKATARAVGDGYEIQAVVLNGEPGPTVHA